MIRYHVRDLGHGYLELGGLNNTGAAVFTEVTSQLPGATVTNISSIADPAAAVVRFPNVVAVSSHHPHWAYFSTSAGGINKSGVAVGTAVTDAPNGGYVPSEAIKVAGRSRIATLAPVTGFISGFARDINDDGVVVGESGNQETSVATLWRNNTASRIDQGLTSPLYSRAHAINNNGMVVGEFRPATGPVRAWMRKADGATEQNLGPAGTMTIAYDVNDAGRIVGGSGDSRAWRWDRVGGLRELSRLPGASGSIALGVNKAGAIVGGCDDSACLWDATQASAAPVDLNAVASTPDNGRLSVAYRINDNGLILCAGYSDLGSRRVYLLTPYAATNNHPCAVSDQVLMSYDPQGAVFGVNFPCRVPGDIPMGVVPVTKLCQLVSASALDCPGCMRLLDAPCGRGWGISVEGVPLGVDVSLYADKRKVADLCPGIARNNGKPYTSKAGKRTLEVVFAPTGKHEYFLAFRSSKRTKPTVVFPVRLTIFRDEGKTSPLAPLKKKAAVKPAKKPTPSRSAKTSRAKRA